MTRNPERRWPARSPHSAPVGGRYLNLWREAAVTLQGILPVPDAFRTLVRASIEQERAKAAQEKDPAVRQLSEMRLDAVAPTLTGDAYDACVAMGSQAGPGKDGGKGAPMSS